MTKLLTKLTMCTIVVSLIFVINLHAENKTYNSDDICNSIYWSEGGTKAHSPFGINPKAANCDSYYSCRQICKNTVLNKYRNWLKKGEQGDFLVYLSKRYAEDSTTWEKNVRWFLLHPKEISDVEISAWNRKQICATGNYPDRNCK